MNARKRLFASLFAALSVLLFTACGRWDYSREAVKAANEAQGDTLRVEFKVNQTFTSALRAAVEDNIQPNDVDNAMTMDKSIEKLLTSGYRLDVYALRADVDADQAAAQLADEFVNRLAGCEDEGYIGMVKADNSYFYMAVLTYKHGGGSGSGSGGGDEGGSESGKYKITLDLIGGDYGTVTFNGAPVKDGGFIEINPGETVDIQVNTADADEDFQIASDANYGYGIVDKPTTTNGVVTGNTQTDIKTGKYELSAVSGDATVKVEFATFYYIAWMQSGISGFKSEVTYSDGIELYSNAVLVKEGGSSTIKVQPGDTYTITSLKINNKSDMDSIQSDGSCTKTFNNISESYIIKIYYDKCKVENIRVTTQPTKTVYRAGEKFDPDGIEVFATYMDGTSETIHGDDRQFTGSYSDQNGKFQCLPNGETNRLNSSLKTSDTYVLIKYGEAEAKVSITVTQN